MAKSKTSDQAYSYVMFECCLINHIERTSEILNYSIVRYALKEVEGTSYQILNEALKLHFDKLLPSDLSAIVKAAGIGERPSNQWETKNAYCLLVNYLHQTENTDHFTDSARLYYQVSQAYRILNLKLVRGTYAGTIKDYKAMISIVDIHERRFGKDALVSIKTGLLIEYSNTDKYRPDFELLRGFLAVKSIQGDKDFACTNKAMITARMIGAKTANIADHLCAEKATAAHYKRFNEQYFYRKLLLDLQLKSFIASSATGNRCIYLSTQLTSELLTAAIQNSLAATQRKEKVASIKADRQSIKKAIYK
ncbi:hypothetical protein [Mucilaginibacter pedocola]|uniref:Uncharacterized protein n=1 Tax=Mucilaginibacter pedocola TaxID=1792845 RepID=A0A1S9P857_9SPHI|nr:hypothetical protein [Mucilaginibacter pedocola]OOQ57122.1 hypothetical protein BC343_16510 [Mucilaginibacter pedocola]